MGPISKTSAPDYIEPFYGWRAWHLSIANPERPRLVSITRSQTWEHPHIQAQCFAMHTIMGSRVCHRSTTDSPIEAPNDKCTCGIYSAKRLHDVTQYVATDYASYSVYGPTVKVLGIVKSWGKIIEHERGFRAEFAAPVLLCLFMNPYVRRIDPSYGVRLPHVLSQDFGIPCYRLKTVSPARPYEKILVKLYGVTPSEETLPMIREFMLQIEHASYREPNEDEYSLYTYKGRIPSIYPKQGPATVVWTPKTTWDYRGPTLYKPKP
jgi:hypothetical protein